MNEASNFCQGPCYASQATKNPVKNKLPYVPTARDLEIKSLPLDSVHADGITELDAHSLFGTQEVKATHEWFQKLGDKGTRTMIIERSGYAGVGKFASRWLGDNWSSADYMGYSVTGVMAHNIIGIPLAGSDICGFLGNTTAELCARWHVVGAFYPFSRNHNGWDSSSQEPYVFEEDIYDASATYLDIMRMAMRLKYSMVRYYYTQITMLHLNGGAFYKPLFFEYPEDIEAYQDQELNIMLGSALKLSVQTKELGKDTTAFYFPADTWCDVFKRTSGEDSCKKYDTGQRVDLESKAYNFHVHLRAGHIIPLQNVQEDVKTTVDLQNKPVDFHVHPKCDDKTCTATGDYLNDDGLVLDLEKNQNQYQMSFSMNVASTDLSFSAKRLVSATNYKDGHVNKNDALGTVEIYNAKALGLSETTFTVQAVLVGLPAVDLPDATYDALADRVVVKVDKDVWLPQLDHVQLS